MPDHTQHQDEGDYATLSRRMESQRRLAGANEIAGMPIMYEMPTPTMYEMMGDLPSPMELDDERSRKGLFLSPSADNLKANASRSSSASRSRTDGPVSDLL